MVSAAGIVPAKSPGHSGVDPYPGRCTYTVERGKEPCPQPHHKQGKLLVSTKRLRQRTHERLTLAPLTFEEALKGAFATQPPMDETDEQAPSEDVDGDGV